MCVTYPYSGELESSEIPAFVVGEKEECWPCCRMLCSGTQQSGRKVLVLLAHANTMIGEETIFDCSSGEGVLCLGQIGWRGPGVLCSMATAGEGVAVSTCRVLQRGHRRLLALGAFRQILPENGDTGNINMAQKLVGWSRAPCYGNGSSECRGSSNRLLHQVKRTCRCASPGMLTGSGVLNDRRNSAARYPCRVSERTSRVPVGAPHV